MADKIFAVLGFIGWTAFIVGFIGGLGILLWSVCNEMSKI